jgi:2-oxo-3-hexenedioate decarboxylase
VPPTLCRPALCRPTSLLPLNCIQFVGDGWPGLDLATWYAVQDETLRRRLGRGERLAGLKLGLTSRVKQQRMGIATPLTAWLTDAMVLADGEPVPGTG